MILAMRYNVPPRYNVPQATGYNVPPPDRGKPAGDATPGRPQPCAGEVEFPPVWRLSLGNKSNGMRGDEGRGGSVEFWSGLWGLVWWVVAIGREGAWMQGIGRVMQSCAGLGRVLQGVEMCGLGRERLQVYS